MTAAATSPREAVRAQNRPQKQPPYHVVLLDDDDHTYEYVIRMMHGVFGIDPQRGYQLAKEVDESGRVICLTTTLEHAELKQEQIHAWGADPLLSRSKGSMTAILEPAEA